MHIGIIGAGDMGILYAKKLSHEGYDVCICDLPGNANRIKQEIGDSKIEIFDDGREVSRKSDYVIYSVETENIHEAVKKYGPSTKYGAIVGGQTSVKTPDIEAFKKYLPSDTNIVTMHSLHSPNTGTEGQKLAVIRHRSGDTAYGNAIGVLNNLGSYIVEIDSYENHDKISADTQCVTHLGFESMGTAWKNAGIYPWDEGSYSSPIDNVKIMMMLRILSGKPHVYGGLAMFNPYTKKQTKQYASSTSEFFKDIIINDKKKFSEKVRVAKEYIFSKIQEPILNDEIMKRHCINGKSEKPNSHLSLFAMADAWLNMGMNPYDNRMFETPPFKMRLGIVEYLFSDDNLIENQ